MRWLNRHKPHRCTKTHRKHAQKQPTRLSRHTHLRLRTTIPRLILQPRLYRLTKTKYPTHHRTTKRFLPKRTLKKHTTIQQYYINPITTAVYTPITRKIIPIHHLRHILILIYVPQMVSLHITTLRFNLKWPMPNETTTQSHKNCEDLK